MAVHLFGNICEMKAIMSIAEKHKLYVIEDNAQAQGAVLDSQFSASIGHINSTSFYPGKNLGALGDAGIITTNNEQLAQKAYSLRNYGSSKKYVNEYIGMNSRLDEMQAALLSVKLHHLQRWNQERIKLAEMYHFHLKEIQELILPKLIMNGEHIYHIYSIRTAKRDQLSVFLETKGIKTLIHYPIPPHLQKAYKFMHFQNGMYPIAEEMSKTSLSLPIYPGLKEDDIIYIAQNIKQYYS